MEVDHYTDCLFYPGNQFTGSFGHDQTCHILDADRIAIECVEFLCHFDERGDAVDRACCIADRSLQVRAGFFHLLHRPLHVPDIIQGIKNAEDINPVFMGSSNEAIHHVIRVMAVADKVLAAKEHLDRGVVQFSFE